MSTARGEVILEGASRGFRLPHERSRTLKELFVTRRRAGERKIWALRDVDLRIAPGDAVGIIGRNGAGKTSILRVLAGILPLDSGRVDVGGTISSLLELGAGFADDFTGRENIHLCGALLGLSKTKVADRIDEMIEFSELGDFVEAPIKSYSSGMYLRLGFSIAAHIDADVLLFDEILAVGDEAFQRKCLRKIAEQRERGATLALVSHDPGTVERVCDRVVVIEEGRKIFEGNVAEGILTYHRLLGTDTGSGQTLRRAAPAGALAVTDLSILDGAGQRRRVFRTGEAMRVEMTVSAATGPTRPGLALEVRDTAGAVCFRTDRALGQELPAQLAYEVPALPLLGGDYDLAVSAYDQDDSTTSRVLDRVARFSVADTSEGEGIADLRGEWVESAPREAVAR